MRRIIFALIVITAMSAQLTPAKADDKKVDDKGKYADGLWIGTARITGSSDPNWFCSTWDFPLIFYVRDGVAKSAIELDWLNFETKIKSKGRINIYLREFATVNHGGGWEQEELLEISGKLKGSSGKGQLTVGGCVGKWKAERSRDKCSKGVEFATYEDKIFLFMNGKLIRALKPVEGRVYTDVQVANNYFIVHIGEDPENGMTAIYSFDNPAELRQISSIPGHYNLEGGIRGLENRGFLPSLSEGVLRLMKGEQITDSILPGTGRTIADFTCCGDFIAIIEKDDKDVPSTVIYYVKGNGLFSIVGILHGEHRIF